MQPVPGHALTAGVVIPIRAFTSGKARLAEVLDHDERVRLAVSMAGSVVAAARPLPMVIVSSAGEVREWAHAARITVIDDPGTGLNAAVDAGCAHLRALGLERVIVAHADLPRARPGSLAQFAQSQPDIVTIVPCHRDDGTPVLSRPATATFPFAYGPDSARLHADNARQAGFTVRIVRDAELGFDVDLPEDLPDLIKDRAER